MCKLVNAGVKHTLIGQLAGHTQDYRSFAKQFSRKEVSMKELQKMMDKFFIAQFREALVLR